MSGSQNSCTSILIQRQQFLDSFPQRYFQQRECKQVTSERQADKSHDVCQRKRTYYLIANIKNWMKFRRSSNKTPWINPNLNACSDWWRYSQPTTHWPLMKLPTNWVFRPALFIAISTHFGMPGLSLKNPTTTPNSQILRFSVSLRKIYICLLKIVNNWYTGLCVYFYCSFICNIFATCVCILLNINIYYIWRSKITSKTTNKKLNLCKRIVCRDFFCNHFYLFFCIITPKNFYKQFGKVLFVPRGSICQPFRKYNRLLFIQDSFPRSLGMQYAISCKNNLFNFKFKFSLNLYKKR